MRLKIDARADPPVFKRDPAGLERERAECCKVDFLESTQGRNIQLKALKFVSIIDLININNIREFYIFLT